MRSRAEPFKSLEPRKCLVLGTTCVTVGERRVVVYFSGRGADRSTSAGCCRCRVAGGMGLR